MKLVVSEKLTCRVRRPDLPFPDSGGHTSNRQLGGHTSDCSPKPVGHGRPAEGLSLLSRLCFRGRPVQPARSKSIPRIRDPGMSWASARGTAVQPARAERAHALMTLQC